MKIERTAKKTIRGVTNYLYKKDLKEDRYNCKFIYRTIVRLLEND
jgi:hypothetical protein